MPKILIVDDLEENLSVLEGILLKFIQDVEVETALGGNAGLKAVLAFEPDVVLLDAKMPDLDGFEVCRRIKKDPRTVTIPVLMISGIYIAPRDRVSGLESGADGYICKPYQTQELIAQVNALLRIKHGEDQLRRHEEELEEELARRSGALKESEARFRMLFEHSPEAIQVVSLAGVILDANPAACRMYGLDRDQMIDRNIQDFTMPDRRGVAMQNFERMVEGKTERVEAFNLSADGASLSVEVMARRIDFGGNVALLMHIRDITERKRIEDALREVAQGVSSATGFSFFYSLVQHLARALNADYVVLGELTGQSASEIMTLAVYAQGEIADNITLDMDASPCAVLRHENVVCYSEGVQEKFPQDRLLAHWEVHTYIGARLADSSGRCVGILAVMNRKPLEDPQLAQSMLQIFASRASSELERKKAAEELWESEEKYRSLTDDVLDTSSIGTMILDAQFCVVWANQAFEKFFNIQREDIIGQDKRVLLEQMLEGLGNSAAAREQILASYQGKGYLDPMELHVREGGGRDERWLEHWNQPIRSGLYIGGRIEHYADVTARKHTEAERNRMAMAVEQAVEAMIITDMDGTLQYVNPAFEQITGYARNEAIGRNPRILKSGKHDETFYRDMWETLTQGGVWSGRITNRRKDGSHYQAELIISPMRDATGRLVNYVAVSRDITREVELEEQFRQAQKMESVGRLAGGIAHDFNNLLTSILGFSRLIMDQVEEDHPIRGDVQEIVHAGERAAKLTRQLLAFGRKQIMQVHPLDLNAVVMDMDQLLRRTLGEDVELVTILGEEIGTIEADVGLLEQVIMNLAVNARDAMPKGGKLTISTRPVALDAAFCRTRIGVDPGHYVLLAIRDMGGGMTKHVRDHAFEPFFTTKEKGKGTGLGLATVYGIVKQCNGHIELESELNVGTEFQIYLPRVDRTPTELPRRLVRKSPRGEETVLVVEDEDTVRHLTVRMLKTLGYHVLEARHGGEALMICERYKQPIHLILTDVVMPHMSGHELIKRLVGVRDDFRILYTSGFTEDRILDHGLAGKTVDILLKPYTGEALAQKVRQVLDEA
jgi:PAS domain S-box-containing protein